MRYFDPGIEVYDPDLPEGTKVLGHDGVREQAFATAGVSLLSSIGALDVGSRFDLTGAEKGSHLCFGEHGIDFLAQCHVHERPSELLLLGFWIFMLRQMQSGGNKALSFGKSRAKLLNSCGSTPCSCISPARVVPWV